MNALHSYTSIRQNHTTSQNWTGPTVASQISVFKVHFIVCTVVTFIHVTPMIHQPTMYRENILMGIVAKADKKILSL